LRGWFGYRRAALRSSSLDEGETRTAANNKTMKDIFVVFMS
jgi:hypothetical protein